jgi:hypothetical protein
MRAAENSASAPLNLDEARDVVLALAPDVLAEFETRLAEFDSGERKIGCEAAIEYAADFLSKAYTGERADPRSPEQIARSMMRHAMRESLGLNLRTNVLSFRPEYKPAPRARRTKRPGSPTPFSWRTLKRREWLHANHYIRGFVSATIAPGGVGKSTNAIVEVLAMVTGLPLPHRPALRTAPGKRLRVWYVNGEDPIEETERRFQAAMLHFGVKPEDVEGRLFIDSGHDQDFVFARENGRVVAVVEPVVDSVMVGIKEKGIDCLILDPVVSFHAVAENDNTKLQQVLEQFSAIANEAQASVELVAHTRKANGNEITADDARGASALHDKVRSLRTVNRMTEKEGEKAGLSVNEFKSVFRLDNGKASMTKAGAGSTWRRLVSVRIESGDDVGVCDAWHWPSAEDLANDLTLEQVERVKVTLGSGNWRESQQAKDWAGYAIMLAVGLDPDDKDERPKARARLAGLIKSGTLKIETREDRSQGRSVKYVITA